MQAFPGGPIKIGSTDHLLTRQAQLEAIYGAKLEVLAVMPGGREEEAAIHEKFSRLRMGRTEQFSPSDELLEFFGLARIETIAATSPMNHAIQVVGIKGTDAWKQWVERGAKHAGMSVSTLVDQSLRAYLKKAGFTEAPPER